MAPLLRGSWATCGRGAPVLRTQGQPDLIWEVPPGVRVGNAKDRAALNIIGFPRLASGLQGVPSLKSAEGTGVSGCGRFTVIKQSPISSHLAGRSRGPGDSPGSAYGQYLRAPKDDRKHRLPKAWRTLKSWVPPEWEVLFMYLCLPPL